MHASRWWLLVVLGVSGLGTGALGAALVGGGLQPPALRLHGAGVLERPSQPGRGAYLVAKAGGKQKEDQNVVTIKLNVKPFVTAFQAQLSAAAAAASAAATALADASAAIADVSQNVAEASAAAAQAAAVASEAAAKQGLAAAHKAAEELETLIRKNPNEAAAVGVSVAAAVALKALMAPAPAEATVTPTLLQTVVSKLSAAAEGSVDALGGHMAGLSTTLRESLAQLSMDTVCTFTGHACIMLHVVCACVCACVCVCAYCSLFSFHHSIAVHSPSFMTCGSARYAASSSA